MTQKSHPVPAAWTRDRMTRKFSGGTTLINRRVCLTNWPLPVLFILPLTLEIRCTFMQGSEAGWASRDTGILSTSSLSVGVCQLTNPLLRFCICIKFYAKFSRLSSPGSSKICRLPDTFVTAHALHKYMFFIVFSSKSPYNRVQNHEYFVTIQYHHSYNTSWKTAHRILVTLVMS